MRVGDWESDPCVACHHRGGLNGDFGVLKVDGENTLPRVLPEISTNVDECCHQEKVACCTVWVSMKTL